MRISIPKPYRFLFFTVFLTVLLLFSSIQVRAASITRDETASFKDIAIAQVNTSVNVRSKASTKGAIVGKMLNNTAAVITDTIKTDNGIWYQIESGSVKGYIKASYFVTGKKAAAVAKKTGTRTAVVTASGSLRLREQPTTKSASLGSIPTGRTLKVLAENIDGNDGYTFMKVNVSLNGKNQTGYVAQKYVKFRISMNTATKTAASAPSKDTPAASTQPSTNASSSSLAYKGESKKSRSQRIFGTSSYQAYKTAAEAKADMTSISVKVWDFDANGKKQTKTKTFLIHKNIAATVKQIFKEIYEGPEKFPIHTIGGYSWRGNNSSSEHCEGLAIDINPNENPMINKKTGAILSGKAYNPGVNPYSIPENGDVVKAFEKYGFIWGDWSTKRDYMHFSYFGT